MAQVHPSRPCHESRGISSLVHPFVPREVREHSCEYLGKWRVTLAVDLLAFPKVVLHSLHCGETAELTTSAKYSVGHIRDFKYIRFFFDWVTAKVTVLA